MGCIICTQKKNIDKASENKVIKIISIIAFVMASGIAIYINKANFIISFLLVLCIYIFIPRKTNKFMEFIDKNSFGLYLFHSPLIYFMFAYIPNINPIVFATISFIGLGCIALFITLLMRKIGLGMLIGEKKKRG